MNKDFGFRRALALVPYLDMLGISHLYVSPISQARKGSTHGYDVTDPSRLNEELGTAEDFEKLAGALQQRGMGLLLDIVPNHMAASTENPWWMDVLENGPASPYSSYFDVEWGHGTPEVQEKIYLPILGEPYGDALEQQKLHLWIHETGLRVSYYDTPFPLAPNTYYTVLSYRLHDLLARLYPGGQALEDYGALLEVSERMPSRALGDWDAIEMRQRDIPLMKEKLWDVYTTHPEARDFIDENIRIFNGTKGDAASFDLLDDLLRKQAYELAYWRVAREKINYRRFFDVTDLIGIRTQDPQVFEATHAFALDLLRSGKVSGFRVDHVDGLYDPAAYLATLQDRCTESAGKPVYITVEKILAGDETLPDGWPTAGTTGYDFLAIANNVFADPEGLQRLDAIYSEFTDTQATFYDVANEQKRKIMRDLFVGEMGSLALHLQFIAEQDRHARDLSPQEIRRSLIEATISMPVYRTYVRDAAIGDHDRECLRRAVDDARRRNPPITPACFDFLDRVFTLRLPESAREDALRFIMRWQQLTGPIMAKGVEDTTLYVYNRLLSMNDVGGNPEPLTVDQFHAFQAHRNAHWPNTMNASTTHDTKRSEDVRARLNVLTEIADAWGRHVRRWSRWNQQHKTTVDGAPAPDGNDEYLVYQTLAGAWPIEVERLKAYLTKAAREAKVHTSWINPNEEYEQALLHFAESILDAERSGKFLSQFQALERRIAFYGAINSLSQTLLKITCPGVPDFYQDTTSWYLRLVDPDNRVAPEIESFEAPARFDPEMLDEWQDGRIKTWLISRSLCFRKAHPDLFEHAEYIPLKGTDRATDHTICFVRRHQDKYAAVVAPRFTAGFSMLEKFPLGRRFWKDAYVILPDEAPAQFNDVLTGETVNAALAEGRKVIYISDALKSYPAALLSNV